MLKIYIYKYWLRTKIPISLNNVNLKFVIPKDFITLVLMEKEPCPFLLDKKNGYGRRRRGVGGGQIVHLNSFWIEV